MAKAVRSILLIFIVLLGGGIVNAEITLEDIANRIRTTDCYSAKVDYEVLLPNFSDPVHYEISLQNDAKRGAFAPGQYIIDWKLDTPVSHSEGFSAYFDGTHFRFRDRRLQEYHLEENREVFAPLGDYKKGVQYQAQFTELLPQFIADKFCEMATDSTYQYTITQANDIKVKGVRRILGYDSMEYEYVLDNATYMPKKIELENNPGQIGEQVVTVTYSDTQFPANCDITQRALEQAYSDVFEKYRSNSFTLEQLVGGRLPQISAKTLDGERYTRNRDEAGGHPMILAFVDAQVGTTPQVVAAIRGALDFLPMSVDVVWAFMNRRAEDISPIIGTPRTSETVLVNATSAARECGVGQLTPGIIFVDGKGNVTDFNLGFNQDLQSVVIQKAGLSASR